MIPIHELLSRIRWDPEFGQGDFAVGYYDRVEDSVIVVPFESVAFEPGDHFSFQLIASDGTAHSIPLHRIRDIYKNGERIWHRDA